ncbi:MAG: hypothetical protein COS65_01530, partial [Armatimonadetes bacterium CG06_land_8_20_14_3_00_66_21]
MPLPSAAGARQPRTAEDRLVRSLERQVARLGAEGKGAQVGALLGKVARERGHTKAGLRAQVLQAQRALGKRKGDEAKAQFDAVLKAPGKSRGQLAEKASAQYGLGRLALAQKQYANAILAFQKTVADYADVAEREDDGSSVAEKAAFQIGTAQLAAGRRAEGVATLKRFVREHPDCYLAHRAQELLDKLGAGRQAFARRGSGAPAPGHPAASLTLAGRRSPDRAPAVFASGRPSGRDGGRGQETGPSMGIAGHTPDPTCGPKALAVALAELGVLESTDRPVTPARHLSASHVSARSPSALSKELAAQVKSDRYGTTFAELKKAAARYGAAAQGKYAKPKALRQVRGDGVFSAGAPALCWVNRNHFVAVLGQRSGLRGGSVRVYDPAGDHGKGQTTWTSLDEFARSWDGYVLTLQKTHDVQAKAERSRKLTALASTFGSGLRAGAGMGIVGLGGAACLLPLCLLAAAFSCHDPHRRRRRQTRRLLCLGLMVALVAPLTPLAASPRHPVTPSLAHRPTRTPAHSLTRALSAAEMHRIRGAQAGGAEPWEGEYALMGCESCGGGGETVGGSPTVQGVGGSGNLFLSSLSLQTGGLVLPVGVKVFLSSQDSMECMPGMPKALRTNYNAKAIGSEWAGNTGNESYDVRVTDEDGNELVFTRDGLGGFLAPAGHHEELTARFEWMEGGEPGMGMT